MPRRGDVRRVERILRNLVTNAIDHGRPATSWWRSPATRKAAAVTVRDHGIGLGPGESAMVFNGVRPLNARAATGRRPGPGHRLGGRAPARRLAPGVGQAG
ncbi:MAG: ATP-binding protein [Nocardioides sp.]